MFAVTACNNSVSTHNPSQPAPEHSTPGHNTPEHKENEANGLPRVYDLRKQGGVTSIKNQYKDGGCRSFASLAALESHIKIKDGVELDLSENNMEMRHGFYFMGKKTREGRNRESAIPYLINGLGPILEADDPYTPMQLPTENHLST